MIIQNHTRVFLTTQFDDKDIPECLTAHRAGFLLCCAGRVVNSAPPSPTQMAVYPTPASREPSAAASPMGPGHAAPALWASWAMAPTVRTWTRWVTPPWAVGALRSGAASHVCLSPQCALVPDICFSTSKVPRCVNTQPGFHCLPCPPRYRGNQPVGVGLDAAKTEKQVRKAGLPCVLRAALEKSDELGKAAGGRRGRGGVARERHGRGWPGEAEHLLGWAAALSAGCGAACPAGPLRVRPPPLSC